MLSPVRTSAPSDTPVSLTEVKGRCSVESNDRDAELQMLLNDAVSYLDGWTGILGRALVTQTWRQDFDAFTSCLRLPVGPVASVTSVAYYDADNALVAALSSDVWILRHDALGAYVDLKPDQDWPSSYAREDAVSVTYVAGTAVADVPAALKSAILFRVMAAFYPPTAFTKTLLDAAETREAPFRKIGV
jgi:uncharacterized phiE125 gp8 family phage protein